MNKSTEYDLLFFFFNFSITNIYVMINTIIRKNGYEKILKKFVVVVVC